MKIAATGHRPHKLDRAYELKHPINIMMGNRMREVILELSQYNEKANEFKDNQVVTIISGMALGVDTVWALVALKLRKQFPHKFKLECAVPCIGQDSKWNKKSQELYHLILEQADKVTYVSKTRYTPTCMQKRNEYMVNQADYIYGVWDGTTGGTKNCIEYAKKQGKKIIIDDPTSWIEMYRKKKSLFFNRLFLFVGE